MKTTDHKTTVSLEKARLERLEKARLAEAVKRYCTAGHALEDTDLIDAQAFPSNRYGRGHT